VTGPGRGDATGPVVGVVGGGQLARMLAEAASPLGVHLRVLAGPGDEGAPEVVADTVTGAADDEAALRSFAAGVDVLTFDHENVDHGVLRRIESAGTPVRPGVATLEFSDKAHQRRAFDAAGLPVPPYSVVDPVADRAAATVTAVAFADAHGGGLVAKASRGGYDGRGVWMLSSSEVADFVADYDGAPLVLEPRLDLRCEVAVLVARRPSGEVRTWPVLETVQVDGMCDEVLLPAPVEPALAERAGEVAGRVAEVTGAVGVLAVELFVVVDGDGPTVLVNEIAPRVHNSGHLTIEGCRTSQFEQHLRAVLDWPLGPTDATAPAAVMANVVGVAGVDPRRRQELALAEVPEAHVHLYGKTPRPARKIGHVTVLGDDLPAVRRRAGLAADLLSGAVEGSGA
jgi:5-(carboxyamino)imidazole ribonucleotide synthase